MDVLPLQTCVDLPGIWVGPFLSEIASTCHFGRKNGAGKWDAHGIRLNGAFRVPGAD
jgi:hypothetical protein